MPEAFGQPGPTGSLTAIVLAAGKGTRMNADLPKVCFPVGGRPMVCAVVDACLDAGCERVVAVVGYKREAVESALAPYGSRVTFAHQAEQLGTGHAVLSAADHFHDAGPSDTAFVLCGDGPLIRGETLGRLLELHRSAAAAATLATSVIPDATGYGRIVRDAAGRFAAIVEHKNASEAQRAIREVNPSYYCFNTRGLFDALQRVRRDPVSGEYYITDVPGLMLASGGRVEVIAAVPPEDILSINTPEQLAEVDRLYRARRHTGAGT